MGGVGHGWQAALHRMCYFYTHKDGTRPTNALANPFVCKFVLAQPMMLAQPMTPFLGRSRRGDTPNATLQALACTLVGRAFGVELHKGGPGAPWHQSRVSRKLASTFMGRRADTRQHTQNNRTAVTAHVYVGEVS